MRSCIKAEKIEIKHRKWCLSVSGINYDRQRLKESQRYLQMYRHELNRLKGMNNVVVPRQVRMATYPARHGFGFGYECVAIGLCACGAPLRDDECKYCQRCGKRVLWEEVE
ncbi:MAG: hypothetical protein IKT51_02795 [Phascolarctobacterium sp.]|nr:hypothetical protein [Phascolarctobacterium sp.]